VTKKQHLGLYIVILLRLGCQGFTLTYPIRQGCRISVTGKKLVSLQKNKKNMDINKIN